jgi:putative membrane protein
MEQLADSRVLFAAERTLLAWNRTCVAMMGFGLQPFATLGIVANLGVAVAGSGLTIYLAIAAS